jgi:CubicO group peptidase (beta-lactamase class C family)
MTHSDPNNIPHQSDQMATPYTQVTETGLSPDWHEAPHDIGSPAGGAISSADDLVRFAVGLRSGKLVSNATFAQMTRAHGPTPPGFKYGYAMGIEEVYGRTFVGHNGGFPGVSTHLYMLLDSPYTIVVLSNQDPPAEAYAGSQIAALVAEKAKLGK